MKVIHDGPSGAGDVLRSFCRIEISDQAVGIRVTEMNIEQERETGPA